ncbi:MFS general substrate transporter [Aaosphaeria arxii CBS 175.79]|uniref:MFS general substrate transporter n=1 Tax=Aaosphaeria arxii CBS 175.79 TaxID=1450172 RepID=A0A6A5Y0V1_9PLEO|nr:MFS general substrate transporter [Aaosphaeria arxii CBS 175.79]KAF2018879.1 MFS general substrate transporter [Aaosphaeria arxii CBS 175.79]
MMTNHESPLREVGDGKEEDGSVRDRIDGSVKSKDDVVRDGSAIGDGGRRDATKGEKSDEVPATDGTVEAGELEVDEKKVDEPPNGGYGWVMVACCAIINAHTWGLNSSYGVFLAYYLANDVFPGATPLQYAFIGGLSISQALAVSPVATMTTRLYGTRTTLLIGVFFETISLIGASFSTKIWHLFLSQGVCFGWGMGFLFVGSVVIAPQWFSTKRSLANGISAAGSGVGGLIYSLAAQSIIRNVSLAWAFRILGIIAGVVNFTCAILVKDRNKQIGSSQLSFDHRLFKRIEFLGLLTFGFLSMLGYIVLLFSLPSYARSVGMDARQGSIIGAVLNLGQAMGRPPIGYFSDSFGRVNMAATMTFLSGLFALVVWMFADSFGVLIFYAIVGGAVAGTYWAVVAPVTTEIMGIVDLPSCLSITWLVLVLPTTFAEPIALEIVAFNGGTYRGATLFAGFMYVGAAGFLWLVRAWKMGELERQAAILGRRGSNMDPLTVAAEHRPSGGEGGREVGGDVKITPFVTRLFKWQRV